jgi:hypothetical protein
MSRGVTHRQKNYRPLQDKHLANVLYHQLVTEFGYSDKKAFARVLVAQILKTLTAYTSNTGLLQAGQLVWLAVAVDGHKHAFKPMAETPLVPVVLDLVTDEDLQHLADGSAYEEVRRQRHARLLRQAHAQGGALSHTDLVALTGASESDVARDIAAVEEETESLLPYRGTVHDIGPTLSHKTQVARLLEEGYLEPTIAQMLSPVHTLRAVERYAQTYKNVRKLLAKHLSPAEISAILQLSPKLMEEYLNLVKEHHPEIVANNPHIEIGVEHDTLRST